MMDRRTAGAAETRRARRRHADAEPAAGLQRAVGPCSRRCRPSSTRSPRTTARACVVLAAAGKAFCAGHDLKEMRAEPSLDYYAAPVRAVRPRDAGDPAAAGAGDRAGAGHRHGGRLPAGGDVRPGGGARDARFAVSGVNFGLFCSTPSVALSRNLARKAAFEMLVTGEFISADEACAKGLVNRVAGADALDAEVERAGREHRRQAARRDRAGQGTCSTASSRPASRPPTRTPASTMACNMMDAQRAGRRAGLHRQAPTELVSGTGS